MWIARVADWHKNTLELEKFMAELLIQRTDSTEIISNKFRSTNGYTQVKELIRLCYLTLIRPRTVRTLQMHIKEAKSNHISQNITNDIIILNYFLDLNQFILGYDTSKLFDKRNSADISAVNEFKHRLELFEIQLDKHYLNSIQNELLKIDYSSSHFQRNADRIRELVDILIPYIIFHGFAASSIYEICSKWLKGSIHVHAKYLNFKFRLDAKKYVFLINLKSDTDEVRDFVMFAKQKYGKNTVSVLGKEVVNDNIVDDKIEQSDVLVRYIARTVDPQMQIRSSFDEILKQILMGNNRENLSAFNGFFERCYWSFFPKEGQRMRWTKARLGIDPICVESRKSTLRDTLNKSKKEFGYKLNDKGPIPIPESVNLKSSLYFYNMAIGSKSIQNSVSLLWTSLESAIPYRTASTDIESVQNFVAKTLALGALIRDIHSFAIRFQRVNEENANVLNEIGENLPTCTTQKDILEWFNWLSEDNREVQNKRVLLLSKYSNLLAYRYSNLGTLISIGTCKDLLNRINASHDSIVYQLQRIYLHRNQIVHAGDLVNEYMNIWIHLEWYVGKILSYSIINCELIKNDRLTHDLFLNVESDYDYLKSYLEKNPNRPIKDSKRVFESFMNQFWQSF